MSPEIGIPVERKRENGSLIQYISMRMHLTLGNLLLVWGDIANNTSTGQISRNRDLDRKVVQGILHSVANAALRKEQVAKYEFGRVQVDETFIGKRKYRGVHQVCRHYAVNHSKKFVSEKGYHTNGAESVHNTIKYWVRLQHYNFGATTFELRRNVALQCVKYGDTHDGREVSWQNRFANLLECIRDHFTFPPEESDEVSSDSCASE